MSAQIIIRNLLAVMTVGLVVQSANAGAVEFNGFGSLYYGQSLEKELLAPDFSDDKADFSTFSLFGLNVAGQLDEKMSVAAQLIAWSHAATGDWRMRANWAYVNWQPNSATSIKLGRQVFPLFIGSEYDKVGQLLPYRPIPGLNTLSPISGFDGLSAAYSFGLGDNKLTVSAFGGRSNYDLAPSVTALGFSAKADELAGATLTLDGDGWRVRAMVDSVRVQLDGTNTSYPCNTSSCEARTTQYAVGYRFDKYNVVSWGEWMDVKGKNGTMVGTTPFLDKSSGGYVLLGYRMGDWLPRYTFFRSDSEIGLVKGGFDAHTVGVNYAVSPTATLKAEYQSFKALEKGSYGLTKATGSTKDTGTAVYAGLDFIF